MDPSGHQTDAESRYAVTDVYDPISRKLLIQYPVWLIVTLSVFGAVAFALVGFFDYTKDPPLYSAAAHDGWPLFLWFCLLLLLLEVTILRDPKRRPQLLAVLTMSLLAILVVTILFYNPRLLLGPFADSYQTILLVALALVNLALLVGFLVGALQRIRRRWQEVPPSLQQDRGSEDSGEAALPTRPEALAGDLLSVATLSAILGLVYSPTPLSGVSTVLFKVAIQRCNVPFTAFNVATVDSVVALISSILGSLVLAIVIVRTGLYGIVRTVRYALTRRVRLLVVTLLVGVREVAWPLLVMIAIASASLAAHFTELYLHLQGNPLTGQANDLLPRALLYLALASTTGFLAFICCTCAAALLLYSQRVLRDVLNILPFLLRYGQVLLLALAAFNGLLWATGITPRTPFFQPSAGTIASIAGFVFLTFVPRLRRSQ